MDPKSLLSLKPRTSLELMDRETFEALISQLTEAWSWPEPIAAAIVVEWMMDGVACPN